MYGLATNHLTLVGVSSFAVFVLSVVLTRLMIRFNIVDTPSDRSAHVQPTPRSGGVAVILSFLVGIIGIYFSMQWSRITEEKFVAFIFGSLVIAFVCFVDDVKGISARTKFFWQFVAGLILVLSGITIQHLDMPWYAFNLSPTLLSILTLVWFVFFMNAGNFMDGLNGLASGSALIACLFLLVISAKVSAYFVGLCAVTLFAATLGFFIFNFPKAHIFLGDTGSQFIPLTIATLGIIGAGHDQGDFSVFTVPLLFYVYVYDVAVTLTRRILSKRSIFSPHRSFVFQVLHRAGLPHIAVSMIHYVHIMIGGAFALAVNFHALSPWWAVIDVTLIFLGYLVLCYLFARRRVTPSGL